MSSQPAAALPAVAGIPVTAGTVILQNRDLLPGTDPPPGCPGSATRYGTCARPAGTDTAPDWSSTGTAGWPPSPTTCGSMSWPSC